MAAVELPVLIIVARASGEPLSQLFATRGFVTELVGGVAELEALLVRGETVPAAAIVDFEVPDGAVALRTLHALRPRPALLGVASPEGALLGEDLLDAAFVRPVDPARLFTRVVKMIAERRKPGKRAARLTGIVAAVHGNVLFSAVERELHSAVPPVNAGAILEKALRDLGTDPTTLDRADLAALLASGRLEAALLPFGDAAAIRESLRRAASLV